MTETSGLWPYQNEPPPHLELLTLVFLEARFPARLSLMDCRSADSVFLPALDLDWRRFRHFLFLPFFFPRPSSMPRRNADFRV